MDKINSQITSEDTRPCSTQATHPMSRAMSLIGDVWTLAIVYSLMGGPRRFGELLETLGNVSPKTVSQRLKMLEQKGFVERRAFAEIPPRVEYHLLAKGYALGDVIKAIQEFGERYLADEDQPDPALSSSAPDQPCAS